MANKQQKLSALQIDERIVELTKNLVDQPKDRKTKILFVNESSILGSGFATYGRELIKRLFATGKYDIAEYGSYVSQQDEKLKDVPWKHYASMPDIIKQSKDGKVVYHPEQIKEYSQKKTNQFGEWKFDHILLEFKPDVVVDVRDWWMVEFEERTPLRKNFVWVLLAPVDGHPQQWEWIATYERTNHVLGYSQFAKNVLEKQSGGRIKVEGVFSPGADVEVFKPMDKSALKLQYFGNPKLKIIGTVMRNQGRKLYPSLIQAYKIFKDQYPEDFKGTVLYLHTSIPDVGWDIRESLKRTNMFRDVVLTYMCQECGHVFSSFIMGDKSTNYFGKCQKCGAMKARCPNTKDFLSPEKLAEIYNLFDVYVQFSISEGFGMPIVEAKACGVPVLCTDNTAMSEQARNGGAFPIPTIQDGPFSTFTESLGNSSNGAMREWDLPSRTALAKMLSNFFKLPKDKIDTLSKQARECVLNNYTWDQCKEKWEKFLDGIKIKDRKLYWDKPLEILNPKNIKAITDIPEGMDNAVFVQYLYKEILNESVDDKHKGFCDWKNALDKGGNREATLKFFVDVANNHNHCEYMRTGEKPKNSNRRIVII